MPELAAEAICKEFPTRDQPLVVLTDITIRFSARESTAIVGPSGSGKSTLLGILGTLQPPTSGQILLEDEDPFTLAPEPLAAFRRSHIGFVFQDHYLMPQLSALENVLVPTLALGRPDQSTIDRAGWLLDRVGLKDRKDHRPAELSGGQRQRVALARALIGRPTVLLADEPTGNLDRSTSAAITELLAELRDDYPIIQIVVTHNPQIAEKMDRRFLLDEGRLSPLE